MPSFFYILFIVSSLSSVAQGETINPKVIYGQDNRKDLYQVNDPHLLELADSTVALVHGHKVKKGENSTSTISTKKFGDYYNLCQNEPFREQPVASFCTGFLVTEDIIATAGHCVNSSKLCRNTKVVFGYALYHANDKPNEIDSNEVYQCKEILHSEVDARGADFALIKLDRKVTNHLPLVLRASGQVSKKEALTIIGHPTGMPAKLADGAHVRHLHNKFLTANLDSFGGNSGSPVFNSTSKEVEGILVRGEMDFEYQNGCRKSKICKDTSCRGEEVTLISEVIERLQKL